MEKNNWECGPGWFALIESLVERLNILGGTATQVKEKYGELRFYYYENDNYAGAVSDWEKFAEEVLDAEQRSRHVCEMCGDPGATMVKGGWLKTVCHKHAKELSYKDKA